MIKETYRKKSLFWMILLLLFLPTMMKSAKGAEILVNDFTMTDVNLPTPYTVSGVDDGAGSNQFFAFDKTTATKWEKAALPAYIIMDLGSSNSSIVTKMGKIDKYSNHYSDTFTISGSNDNSTWAIVANISGYGGSTLLTNFTVTDTTNAYRFWKVNMTHIGAGEAAIVYEIYFWSNKTPAAPPGDNNNTNFTMQSKVTNNFYYGKTIIEDRRFYAGINFTNSTNTTITGAVCNMTMSNVTATFSTFSTTNTTISTSSDNVSLLNMNESNLTIRNDRIKLGVCNVGAQHPDMQVWVNQVNHDNLSGAVIPQCPLYYEYTNVTTRFNNRDDINLSVKCATCNGGNQQLKIILQNASESITYLRTFALHHENLVYNTTNKVYEERDHRYTWLNQVNATVAMQCNNSLNTETISVTGASLSLSLLLNNATLSNGTAVESAVSNDLSVIISGDFYSSVRVNLSYVNGTVIKTVNNLTYMNFSNTQANKNGIYNISVEAYSDDNALYTKQGWFVVNDTVFPTSTWLNPLIDNTSEYTDGTIEGMQINLYDINLFAYNISVYDSINRIVYNDYATGLTPPQKNLAFSVLMNLTGSWKVNMQVADDHTAATIPDYEYEVKDNKLEFIFRQSWNESEVVSIESIGAYSLMSTEVKKETDRYSFTYDYKLLEDSKLDEVTQKYRVSCGGMHYRELSTIPAHFVCWNTRTWIDLRTTDTATYNVKRTSHDAYEVIITDKPSNIVSMHSIGGLNILNESVMFNVSAVSSTPVNSTLSVNVCPTTIEGQMALWLVTLLIVAFIVIALVWKIIGLGIMSSIGLMVISWTIVGCSGMIGYIVALTGIVLIITFAVMAKNA